MRMRWLLVTLLALSCRPVAPSHTGLRLELADAPIWVQVAQAQHAARQAACPATLTGCFAAPPTCAVSQCSCRALCAPGRSVGRAWRTSPAECVCDL